MDMTSSVDSSQCSMAMVSINENDVNDKTDCSGKRVTLRQWSRFVWYYMVFHGHELLWYYRNYSVWGKPPSTIKDDFFWKIAKWVFFNPKNYIADFLVNFGVSEKNRSRIIWKFFKKIIFAGTWRLPSTKIVSIVSKSKQLRTM